MSEAGVFIFLKAIIDCVSCYSEGSKNLGAIDLLHVRDDNYAYRTMF
jgi:hypothetical protein